MMWGRPTSPHDCLRDSSITVGASMRKCESKCERSPGEVEQSPARTVLYCCIPILVEFFSAGGSARVPIFGSFLFGTAVERGLLLGRFLSGKLYSRKISDKLCQLSRLYNANFWVVVFEMSGQYIEGHYGASCAECGRGLQFPSSLHG